MRTQAEIRARIAEIEGDDRIARMPPATMAENAPLAFAQLEGWASLGALQWALGDAPRCAGSFPSNLPVTASSAEASPSELPPRSLDAYEGACLRRAMAELEGDPLRVAAVLGVSKSTVYRLLAKHRVQTGRMARRQPGASQASG